MRRILLAASFLSIWPASAFSLDPETNSPYKLNVVVHFAKHRLFTKLFHEQVKRELRDGLQAALGAMAQVDVADMEEPMLSQVQAKGLQEALDDKSWKKMSDSKTHFVLIDYTNGQYEIQTRQHDGLTGLTSPVVRHAATFDRQFVARTAALLVDEDFGVVGTIDAEDMGPEMKVTLKGGGLGVPMDHWVKKDDVFAIAQVSQGRQGPVSFRVPWAILQVTEDPKDGVCPCHVYSRYSDPLRNSSGIDGYRCLKLGAIATRLRLRLVDDKNMAPIGSFPRVTVSAHGSDAKPAEDLVADVEGLLQTEKTYQNVAFIQVFDNEVPRSHQIPVELLDDRIMICPISSSSEADTLAVIDMHKRRMMEQFYDSLSVSGHLFKELSDLVEKKQNEQALEKARTGLKDLKADIEVKSADLKALEAAADKAGAESRVNTKEGEPLLGELHARESKLNDFIANAEKSIKAKGAEEVKQANLASLISQAQLLEGQEKYDQAIVLYEQALKDVPDTSDNKAKWQAHLDELKNAWQPKNDTEEHHQARTFIYETWPQLNSSRDLNDNLPKARQSFEACQKVGDWITLQKMLLLDVPKAGSLKKEVEAIKTTDSEEAREKIKAIVEISDKLEHLHQDVRTYVQSVRSKTTNQGGT